MQRHTVPSLCWNTARRCENGKRRNHVLGNWDLFYCFYVSNIIFYTLYYKSNREFPHVPSQYFLLILALKKKKKTLTFWRLILPSNSSSILSEWLFWDAYDHVIPSTSHPTIATITFTSNLHPGKEEIGWESVEIWDRPDKWWGNLEQVRWRRRSRYSRCSRTKRTFFVHDQYNHSFPEYSDKENKS